MGRETMDMLHGTFIRNRDSLVRSGSDVRLLLQNAGIQGFSSDSDTLDAEAAAQEAALINTLAVNRASDAGTERPTPVRGVTARSDNKNGRQVKVTKVNLDELFVQRE